MYKWGRTIPFDTEAVEDEAGRFDLQVDILSLALQEPHASLLYFACTSDAVGKQDELQSN